ncbi:MAG TPA: hypothetical protein VF060_12890, partial [Trebonia sp.]
PRAPAAGARVAGGRLAPARIPITPPQRSGRLPTSDLAVAGDAAAGPDLPEENTMTEPVAPDPQPGTPARPQPSPDGTVPPMPAEVTSGRAPRPAGGRWRRAMMPLAKMARRTRRP